MPYVINFFSQAYGACNYGAADYQNSTCQATTGTASGGSSGSAAGGSLLTNTGFDLLLIATLAVTIVLVAVVVRFWKRPSKKLPAPQ